MKRSELTEICNAVVQLHVEDLKTEIPNIFDEQKGKCDDVTTLIANLVANLSVLYTSHTVQAISDVLESLNLIEIEDD